MFCPMLLEPTGEMTNALEDVDYLSSRSVYVRERQLHSLVAFFLSDSMMLVVYLFLVVPRDHFLASLVLSGGAIGIHALVHYSQQLYPEPEIGDIMKFI